MKKWIRTLTGIVMSAFLTFGLGGKALAGDEEEALPEPPLTEIAESAPAVSQAAPAAEAPRPAETVPAAEAPKPAESAPAAEPPKPAETAPAAEPPKPTETVPAEEPPKPAAADPVEENTVPVDVPAPVVEPAPVEEPALAEAPAPVEEPAPAEEPAPVEEPSPVEESSPAEEPAPAQDLPPKAAEEDPEAAVPSDANEASVPVQRNAAYSTRSTAVSSDTAESDPVTKSDDAGTEEDPEDLSEAAEGSAAVEDPVIDTGDAENEPVLFNAAPMLAASAPGDDSSDDSSDASSPKAVSLTDSSDPAGSSSSQDTYYVIDDGSHVMVNHTGGSFTAETENGLSILAAGLNHIDSISGTGTVKIGGTGILLIDSIDSSAEDFATRLELMSFTELYGDSGGSVAVFVCTGENSFGRKQYTLVNGFTGVAGLLDEEYTLDMERVDLIIPDGSELIIGSIGAESAGSGTEYYTGRDSGAQNTGNTESAGHLIIGGDVTLRVNGDITMKDTDSRIIEGYIVPTLDITGEGTVEVSHYGSISGGVIEVDGMVDHTSLTGEGSIRDSVVKNHGHSAITATNLGEASKLGIADVSTEELITVIDGKAVLDRDKLDAFLATYSEEYRKNLIIELRYEDADRNTISSMLAADSVSKNIVVSDENGYYSVAIWDTRGQDADNWFLLYPRMGMNLNSTKTSRTGSGMLGENGVDMVIAGGDAYILRHSEDSPATPNTTERPAAPARRLAEAPLADWRVIVSPRGRYYAVHVYHGTREVADPGRMMTARMKFILPDGWSKNAVFAVFRSAGGSLTAFRAVYSEADGTLSFDTDLTGTFALISFPFDGDPFSEEFYDAISELEDIRLLPIRR